MKSPVPRVSAIHDLSGFGRASLTVIIPILSTMGIQVCPLPTAVLSSHTGGFKNYRLVDLTGNMEDFMDHWRSMELRFDAIYSGFLGSSHQISIVENFIDSFAEKDQLVLVDPVMGDNGKPYGPVNAEQINGMRGLVKKAHVITPNFTEACFLLGRDYSDRIEPRDLRDWLVRLSDQGPEIVVITSVPLHPERNASTVMAYNRADGRFWKVDCTYIPAYYPGTGDAFASVILGSLLQGDSLPIALDRAVQFTTLAVKASFGYNLPRREGVLLERVLGHLKAPLASITYEIVEW